MAKNSMLQLSETLKTKNQQDQKQIEEQTLNELKRHAKNLRDGLSGELGTTKTAISSNLNEINELSSNTLQALIDDQIKIKESSNQNRKAALASIRWGWLKYSLPALSVLVIILGANWGLMQWQSSRLIAMQEQIDQAQRTLNQLPQGVRFAQDGSGRSFLIYENEPQIFQTQSGGWATELKTR